MSSEMRGLEVFDALRDIILRSKNNPKVKKILKALLSAERATTHVQDEKALLSQSLSFPHPMQSRSGNRASLNIGALF
jgi:hypothetical protein